MTTNPCSWIYFTRNQPTSSVNDTQIAQHLTGLTADVLFVALGHPKQEKLLFAVKSESTIEENPLLKYHVGVGVGGAFDYISGNIPRAPQQLRELGLEWLFQLVKEPMRVKRIINAVGTFPLLLFVDKYLVRNQSDNPHPHFCNL